MAEHKPIRWTYPFPGEDTSNNPLQLLTHMPGSREATIRLARTAYGTAKCSVI